MSSLVILFTRTPKEEAHSKQFCSRFDLYSNRQFAHLLIDQTVETIKKSRLPYHICYSDEQIGDTFFERYNNAIKHAFSLGYDRIITVGNDTPLLDSTHLQKAASSNKLVLGPSLDGGFYLMGISKEQYSEQLFSSLSWQSNTIFDEIKSSFDDISVLETLIDIDSPEDFSTVLQSNNFSREIRLFIRTAMSLIELSYEDMNEFNYQQIFSSTSTLRAPPQ